MTEQNVLPDSHFTDAETIKMLKALNCDLPVEFYRFRNGKQEVYHKNNFVPPVDDCWTWQQIKQWLWEKHNIWIYPIRWITNSFDYRIAKDDKPLLPLNPLNYFDTPIIAEIEGIKQAVKYLHSKIK